MLEKSNYHVQNLKDSAENAVQAELSALTISNSVIRNIAQEFHKNSDWCDKLSEIVHQAALSVVESSPTIDANGYRAMIATAISVAELLTAEEKKRFIEEYIKLQNLVTAK